ncbi:hypothetical protein R1flu_024835 [Riccia fluitans]|uniref:DED domain-containing protein n=1 Tax=Riccia fluitans TaxID=41844 RepID=A0ABD1XWZ1_9MARC
MESSTWLKDLVFSAKLLEPDSLLCLRELIASISAPKEQKDTLSRVLVILEENKIGKEAFLDNLVGKLGYVEVGKIILDLYHQMDRRRNISRRSRQVCRGIPPIPVRDSNREQGPGKKKNISPDDNVVETKPHDDEALSIQHTHG